MTTIEQDDARVGERHLGWSGPRGRVHAVTITSSGPGWWTARALCDRPVTSVLAATTWWQHPNLCRECARHMEPAS